MTLSSGQIVWFVLFAAIAAAGTLAARAYALQRRLLDEPGERRSHQVATPRGGGIAIVLAFLVAIVAMMLRQPSDIVLLGCAGMGLLMVAAIGWADDHRPLSPWSRLVVHAVAAGWLAVGFYLSGAGGELALIALLSALLLVNIWNFMDGIDGLAASQAALVSGALIVLAGGGTVAVHLGLALIASISGFLPFNFPKAKIFLGDVGSGALGYALALMVGLSLQAAPRTTWLLVILPLSAFMLDAGFTLIARVLRGERWWMPHVQHAYQRWARRKGDHRPVTAGYAVWTATGCLGMTWLMGKDHRGMVMAVLAWLALGCVIWYWLRRQPDVDGTEERVGA
jgi:UDP-N-acetylmuramyl pentapeptide phosphotransferase/UDP-N-acetylglucosamine-1-phosphate transferase